MILVVGLLLGEVIARFVVGLGELPLFIEDPDYEYIYAPNQEVHRFGNRVATNSFSMRSKPISKKDSLIILKIGDSVTNGGAHVDQDSLASSRLEQELQALHGEGMRVLNISAASWGPDNAYEYVKKHGHFGAQYMVLVFSSHDWHDNRHFQTVVGKHRAWPNEQPMTALTDGFSRYVWPKIKGVFSDSYEDTYLDGINDRAVNSGWQNLLNYAKANQIELVVYLHPEQEELAQKTYNNRGKAILQFLAENGVTTITGMDAGLSSTDYRDHIHLNESGHRKMANHLSPVLRAFINASNT